MTSISCQDRVVQQIISTHSPEDNFNVDEKALLSMAIDILCKAIPKLDLGLKIINVEDSEDKSYQQVITEELAFTILGIGCELSCNCSGGGGMKSITLAVFDKLVKYSWKNKLVITLLAFAINYGELCLLWKQDATNPLTKYVDQLKLLLELCEQENFISRQETLISGLLEVIMHVTKTIIKLNDHSTYFSRDKTSLSNNQIPNAVYWAVKGIVACSSQSIALVNLQYMVSNIEAQKKFTELTQALETIHEDLRHTLTVLDKEREKKKNEEGYIKIKDLIVSTHKTNNVKIFAELIQTQDDKPLFNGVTNKKECLKVLKCKTVILFISNLDILDEEINDIAQRVSTQVVGKYEIVWFPIVDMPNTEKEAVIEKKARLMKWRSLHFSVTLQPYVIQYIKKDWHFEKKPVMVVFNAHGKVVNSNAYHMIMIWGNAAYPFFATKEETLWRNSKWNLEFFIDGVASDGQWLKEGKLACLFDCDDFNWIKDFISAMNALKDGDRIKLIYVGKEQLRDAIRKELPCECWDEWWDEHMIRRFWARLDSILCSKMKTGTSIEEDTAFKDVMTLLGCRGSKEGWTVICQGLKDNIVASNGKTTMKCLEMIQNDGTKLTFENYFTKHQVDVQGKTHGNYNIHIACTSDIIPEKMVCVDCHCPMKKRVTYECSGKK
ncbi:protein SIEVE ELEMENT OCCLUSION B-like protein [Cinnamomum micranthum f. kanehirae]|uniref:Protein SIEVE ELEMENT OCCLUSION B-like protein n=1 Tax=Cinnamomum micranthum f. kanehirae TaxID=337451 RepID=A0A3S3PVS3_9MAGN|nr:protein SIEVE ELEMENT OCCLUSION B-like protein [Cinnamomum micranthum f. kanehirae]